MSVKFPLKSAAILMAAIAAAPASAETNLQKFLKELFKNKAVVASIVEAAHNARGKLDTRAEREEAKELPALQAASAVGQGALFATWRKLDRRIQPGRLPPKSASPWATTSATASSATPARRR